MAELFVLIVSVALCAAIGISVVARNPRRIVNRLYGLLTASLALFTIANYLSLNTDDRLFYIRSVILMSTLSVAFLYYLIVFLDDKGKKLNRWQVFGIYATVVVAILDMTPFVFSGLSQGQNPTPIPASGSIIFLAHLIAFPACSTALLLNRIGRARDELRLQYVYILLGIMPIFLLAPITGFIMPVVIQDARWVTLNPLYVLIFVSLVGYAIVKHKLFDIRTAVVRSVTYILSLTTLVVIYVVVAHSLSGIFNNNVVVNNQTTIGALLALVLALLYQPFRRFFDKLSNRIFYRDAYSSEVLLSELNDVLMNNTDLAKLLRNSARIISTALKVDFCTFIVSTEDTRLMVAGTAGEGFSKKDADLLEVESSWDGQKVLQTQNTADTQLRSVLVRNNVDVLVHLAVPGSANIIGNASIGYIALGHKKSGAAYSRQDVQVLEIIADTTTIAIQNALQFEQIQQFNTTLKQRVDDATRQLKRSNKKLQQLDTTKDEFISMASHQLRTPLTSVKGYLSMVLDGDAGSITKDQRKFLTQAYISSQRMVYTIADLLNVSRLQTGKFIIERSPVTITQIVEEEIEPLRETAKLKNVKLTYHATAFCPPLMLDETKTRQVIMNFIDNALYYTPNGGTIDVQIEATAKMLELRVTDNGIGVPKADQPHMFTKFYRATNAQKVRPDGTGLGLFMAKKVIVAQGGSLIFKSVHGRGSTFGFSFPLVHENQN
ncbi:MAG: ATP-binding protein [Candidatus Saccharimonadales bacterium]